MKRIKLLGQFGVLNLSRKYFYIPIRMLMIFGSALRGKEHTFPDLENEITIRKGMVVLAKPNQIHGMRNTGNSRFMFVGFAAGALPMDITRY
ncbi:hypothetical protein RCO48_36520 [Peribacillus frigoritolerans]|nr:hypothetical protein [Peribacillus frigoritolerans]